MSIRVHSLPHRRSRILARRALAASFAAVAIAPFLTVLPASAASVFTSGDVVIYRVGTAADPAGTSTSTAVTLDEYAPGTANQGGPAYSLAMPTTSGTGTVPNPLTASGKASSEGGLTLSTDGSTLLVPGYSAAPGVASIASTTASATPNTTANTYPREVAEVDVAGDIDTTTTLGATAYSGDNPRSAASVDGSNIWMGGAGGTESTQGGVWYVPKGGNSATDLQFGNFRWVNVVNNQLYADSGSATSPAKYGISQIGTGLPTTGSQTVTPFSGVDTTGTPSPYGFVLLSEGGNGIDTIYVADSSTGIEKYSLSGTTWSLDGTFALPNVTGLVGAVSGNTVNLFATTPTNLVQISDATGTGSPSSDTETNLATAASYADFLGVAFAPTGPAPQTPEVPFVALLPLLAVGFFGGSAWIIVRRRRQHAA